jgi:hypothetical protein
MKTFRQFKKDATLSESKSRKQSSYAPADNEHCRRCKDVSESAETCPICRIKGHVKQSGPFRECGNCKHNWNPALQPPKKPKKVSEDEGGSMGGPMPTNAAGNAQIAGIGIQRKGEPSFAEPGVPVRRKLEIVGPDPVDPRIFADKIFGHSKLADTIHKTGVK